MKTARIRRRLPQSRSERKELRQSLEKRLLLAIVVLTPSKDATLIEVPLGNSNGAGDFLMSGRVSSNRATSIRRAALAFDTSGIPTGATSECGYSRSACVA